MVALGLDFGEARIGVAVTDPLGLAATALTTVERTDEGDEFEELASIAEERGAEVIVVGMPYRTDGSSGPEVHRVRGFIKELKKHVPGVEVETMDERFSSKQAHQAMSDAGTSMRRRKDRVDEMSAQIILTRYLQRRSAGGMGDGGGHES